MVDKVIRDGKVAVLYSPGYGAGWWTWGDKNNENMLFDPVLVGLVEKSESDQITYEEFFDLAEKHSKKAYPEQYTGGLDDLTIHWIPEGTMFRITEYDGAESVEYFDNGKDWYKA